MNSEILHKKHTCMNAKYKINLPDGIAITSFDITGYSNSDSGTAYIEQFGENTFASTDYVLPSRKGGEAVTFSINLPIAATKEAVFVCKDQQIVANLTLHALTTGIHDATSPTTNNNDVYTIDGRLLKRHASASDIQALGKGLYIVGHRKVVVK